LDGSVVGIVGIRKINISLVELIGLVLLVGLIGSLLETEDWEVTVSLFDLSFFSSDLFFVRNSGGFARFNFVFKVIFGFAQSLRGLIQ